MGYEFSLSFTASLLSLPLSVFVFSFPFFLPLECFSLTPTGNANKTTFQLIDVLVQMLGNMGSFILVYSRRQKMGLMQSCLEVL